MKYIKLFEELNPQTYLSASDKLLSRGHKKRAKNLSDHGNEILRKSVDRIDPHKYEIKHAYSYSLGGVYQIIDAGVEEMAIEGGNYVLLSNGPKQIRISTSIIFPVESYQRKWTSGGYLPPSLCIKGPEDGDYHPNFLFQNRKDARNFRNFYVEEFGDCPVSLNDMYSE